MPGINSDDERVVTGRYNVLCPCVKAVSPYAKLIHCRINRKSLATKKIPTKLRAVLDESVQTVNFVKVRH